MDLNSIGAIIASLYPEQFVNQSSQVTNKLAVLIIVLHSARVVSCDCPYSRNTISLPFCLDAVKHVRSSILLVCSAGSRISKSVIALSFCCRNRSAFSHVLWVRRFQPYHTLHIWRQQAFWFRLWLYNHQVMGVKSDIWLHLNCFIILCVVLLFPGKLSVIDLAELNPLIGSESDVERTKYTAVQLLKTCLGFRRSGHLPFVVQSLANEGIRSRADKWSHDVVLSLSNPFRHTTKNHSQYFDKV